MVNKAKQNTKPKLRRLYMIGNVFYAWSETKDFSVRSDVIETTSIIDNKREFTRAKVEFESSLPLHTPHLTN